MVSFTTEGDHEMLISHTAFNEISDSAALMAGDCTSCRVTQDMSAYWHPGVYFQHESSGEFELVPQIGGMLA